MTESIVFKSIYSRGSRDAVGPDCIPLRFWQGLGIHVVTSLTAIFQIFLAIAYISENWKTGYVTPIFKGKGSDLDCLNNRFITVASLISRIFEKVILSIIESKIYKYLNIRQYGFIPHSSTFTNLLDFYRRVYDLLDKKGLLK